MFYGHLRTLYFFAVDLCYYKIEFMVKLAGNTNQNTVQDHVLGPVQPPELSKGVLLGVNTRQVVVVVNSLRL